MTRERKGLDRRWLWTGALVLLIVVFFSARSFTRERLPVKVARAEHEPIKSTISTNARVEPLVNYQYPSPLSTTVKAVYVQPGDHVPAGKLLLVLDDLEARARVASAQSGVKAAEAALDAATQNGTLEQRQASAAEIERNKLDLDQAQHNLDALTRLLATGAASASEVAAARQQLDSVKASLNAAQQSARARYSSAEIDRARAALADAKPMRQQRATFC